MSDIVFLRAWTRVDIPRFYNPVTTLLQARSVVWRGMKTVAELRREKSLPIPVNKDSLYKVIKVIDNICSQKEKKRRIIIIIVTRVFSIPRLEKLL